MNGMAMLRNIGLKQQLSQLLAVGSGCSGDRGIVDGTYLTPETKSRRSHLSDRADPLSP